MTPATIIREAQSDGVKLALSPTGTIKASGDGAAVNRWLAVLREHKAEIVDVLKVGTDDTATASRWWLIHYPDRNPVETASFPPATHAEILERHPEAIAAEPIHQAKPEPGYKSCSTCAHATGRGGCGEPVAAGLSGVVGVIRYSPDQGATCPAWLATISGDLEARIQAMAERWDYSGDDLALALAGARADPAGWLRVVEADETEGGE